MQTPRVNPTLRSTLYHLGRTPLLHRIGTQTYQTIATQVAKRLARIKGVSKVYWRGGAIHRCSPGVSDLDFSLFLDHPTEESLAQIKHHYAHLKKRYLIPSELSLHLEGEFGAYLNVLLHQSKRWQNGWYNHEALMDSKTRLACAIQQLDESYWSLQRLIENGENSFYSGFFLRDASKTMGLARGNSNWTIQRAPADKLIANAFVSVDTLARTLNFNKQDLAFDPDSGTSALAQIWLENFRQLSKHHYELKPTALPFAFILGKCDPHEFFAELLKFLRFSQLGLRVPVRIFSQAQWNVMTAGYCGWGRIHNRSLIGLNVASRPLRERAEVQLALWLGETLTGSQKRADWLLENVGLAIKHLAPQHHLPAAKGILSKYHSLHHALRSLVSPSNTQ